MAIVISGTRAVSGSKYRNRRVCANGEWFDSQKEADRFLILRDMEKRGEIEELKRQQVFALVVNGSKIADYRSDFTYQKGGRLIVEDVKGYKTPAYRLKSKLFLAIYGFAITEI